MSRILPGDSSSVRRVSGAGLAQSKRLREKLERGIYWQRGWDTEQFHLGAVVIFPVLFRTCRDPEDFEKHHPPLEMSFCCAAVLEYFHQRQNSKAAISYCALSPPATINLSPSHRRFSLCPFSVLPFLFSFYEDIRSHSKGDSWCLWLGMHYRW